MAPVTSSLILSYNHVVQLDEKGRHFRSQLDTEVPQQDSIVAYWSAAMKNDVSLWSTNSYSEKKWMRRMNEK